MNHLLGIEQAPRSVNYHHGAQEGKELTPPRNVAPRLTLSRLVRATLCAHLQTYVIIFYITLCLITTIHGCTLIDWIQDHNSRHKFTKSFYTRVTDMAEISNQWMPDSAAAQPMTVGSRVTNVTFSSYSSGL